MKGEFKGWFQNKADLLTREGQRIFSNALEPGPASGTGTTYHWENNTDPDIIGRVTDGTTTVFSVDTEGDVTAKSVTIDQKDTSTTALTVKSAGPSYTAALTQWKDSSSNIRVAVGSTGILNTWARTTDFHKALLDTEPSVQIDPANATINWGAGGSTAVDVNLYRPAADTLKTDDNFIVGGTLTALSGSLGPYTEITVGSSQEVQVRGPGDRNLNELTVGSLATIGTDLLGTPRVAMASFTIPDNHYLIAYQTLETGANIETTLEGSGEIVLTDLTVAGG